MAMGIVSDSDLDQELENLNKPRPQIEHKTIERGRGNNNAVPASLRQIISEEVINGVPAKEIVQAIGISSSSISAYKHDATSTASYNTPNKDLRTKNNLVRDRIIGKSRRRLLQALDNITSDKLQVASLSDLTRVSTAMAQVIDKVELKDDSAVKIDKLLIYAPRVRDEQSYDVIEVRE